MSSTLKELAIALSKKQEHYVDYLTNESPILDNMRFEASTHGLWNAYEEVSKIDGAGLWISISRCRKWKSIQA